MRILVVEDSRTAAQDLFRLLQPAYQVEVATSGHDALDLIDEASVDLVLLATGLSDIRYDELCRRLHSRKPSLPIMIVTGLTGAYNKVRALESGADDYVARPFDERELLARIRALLRRSAGIPVNSVVACGRVALDTRSRKVFVDNRVIMLRRREFDVLEYLLRNQGMVLTRDMIFRNVWDIHAERWSNVVDSQIRMLRAKIEKPFGLKLIKTKYGVGYVIEPVAPQSPHQHSIQVQYQRKPVTVP